jgi:hypothetical protein
MDRKKPTRKDLLRVIGRLQDVTGKYMHPNDRDMFWIDKFMSDMKDAFNLCISATSFDPPVEDESKNGWMNNFKKVEKCLIIMMIYQNSVRFADSH